MREYRNGERFIITAVKVELLDTIDINEVISEVLKSYDDIHIGDVKYSLDYIQDGDSLLVVIKMEVPTKFNPINMDEI